MMNSREVVRCAVEFEHPDRLPRAFPDRFGHDFAFTGVDPSPDARPARGVDEWRAIWENTGGSNLGQVKDFPLKDWRDLPSLAIPDIGDPPGWQGLAGARARAGDKFLLDQQEDMGLEFVGQRFGGRITFYCHVDIQNTMVNGTLEEIHQYCRRIVQLLGGLQGGFIPCWYADPRGAGHRQEAIDAMCEEFLRISCEMHGR